MKKASKHTKEQKKIAPARSTIITISTRRRSSESLGSDVYHTGPPHPQEELTSHLNSFTLAQAASTSIILSLPAAPCGSPYVNMSLFTKAHLSTLSPIMKKSLCNYMHTLTQHIHMMSQTDRPSHTHLNIPTLG